MTNSIHVTGDVAMEMRDGTLLRAVIYQPDDNERHPAILMRTQYDRLRETGSPFMPIFDAVWAGYVIVIQNVRGTFGSEGVHRMDDPYLTIEGYDGYDSVEWLAGQPWSDGNIGMAGGSFLGSTQWAAAKENPPHLKAIAPWISGSGVLPSRLSGVFNLGHYVNHLLMDGLILADKLEKEGKDVSRMRQLLNQGYANPGEVYNYLPLKDVPHADFDVLRDFWHNLVLNPTSASDTANSSKGARPAYEKITVPCCHVSGWYDYFTNGTFRNFHGMREIGASRIAREGQHLLMGPWLHTGPTVFGDTGDLNYGRFSTILGSGLCGFNIAFFNKYLRKMDINLPSVRYFVMSRNMWQDADSWPLAETDWQKFYLHSQGRANTSLGDGLLSRTPPGPEPEDRFSYDPLFPVPCTGCRGHGTCGFASSPKDQSHIENRNDVLCYTTPELKEDIEVTGPLELHLFAATSARDTDFTGKLVDVFPDGSAYNVGDGIIRAQYRKSFFKPEFVTPGEVYEYTINMENTSQLFRKGHRIRIDVSSSSFPEYNRNMNTGNPAGEDAEGIIAEQKIFHQSEYPSYIDLPVIPCT